MPDVEKYENLVLGSGAASKLLIWTPSAQAIVPPWSNADL